MELINNVGKTLRDDLVQQLHSGSRLSIAASCFSIYAFQELKEVLKDIKELRFIFTSPTFTTEKTPKQQREFYIPRLNRERTVYGSEFEVKLRNELTQKAIARECAEWIREKTCFKSNKTNEQMMGFINLDIEAEETIEEQIINREQQEKLLRQIDALEKRCRAEKQTRKRYELYQQIEKLKKLIS